MKKYLVSLTLAFLFFSTIGIHGSTKSVLAQEQFPAGMQGFWVVSEASCAAMRKHGPSILLEGKYKDEWIKISGPDVIGTINGKILRTISPKKVEALLDADYAERKKLVHEFILLSDGRLTEGVLGARAIQYFRKCR